MLCQKGYPLISNKAFNTAMSRHEEESGDGVMFDPRKTTIMMKQPKASLSSLSFRSVIIFCLGLAFVSYTSFVRDAAEGSTCIIFCKRQPGNNSISSSKPAFDAQEGLQEASPLGDEYDDNETKKTLPSFAKGGIIFFLHIPMTEGETIRQALQNGQGQYLLSDNRYKFDKYKRQMMQYIKYGTNNEVVVFELHASDSPSLLEISARLRQWKSRALKNNVPFFAFTVVREPLDFAVSFFNFYHGMNHTDPHYLFYANPSEQDYLDRAVFNPQCGFLAKGDTLFRDPLEQQSLQRTDCESVYQTLMEDMDWVGTTERLSDETIPLLRYLLGVNANDDHLIPENIQSHDRSTQKISKSALSETALERIHELTLWDSDLYDNVRHNFDLAQIQMGEDEHSG